jgi:hypothetical protein
VGGSGREEGTIFALGSDQLALVGRAGRVLGAGALLDALAKTGRQIDRAARPADCIDAAGSSAAGTLGLFRSFVRCEPDTRQGFLR